MENNRELRELKELEAKKYVLKIENDILELELRNDYLRKHLKEERAKGDGKGESGER